MAIFTAKRLENVNFQMKILHRHHFPQALEESDVADVGGRRRHLSLRFVSQHHGDHLGMPAHGAFHQIAVHFFEPGTIGGRSFRKHQKISSFVQCLSHGFGRVDERAAVAALDKHRINGFGNKPEHGPTRNFGFGHKSGREHAIESKDIQKRNVVGHDQAPDLAGCASAVPNARVPVVLSENVDLDTEPSQNAGRPTPNDAAFTLGSRKRKHPENEDKAAHDVYKDGGKAGRTDQHLHLFVPLRNFNVLRLTLGRTFVKPLLKNDGGRLVVKRPRSVINHNRRKAFIGHINRKFRSTVEALGKIQSHARSRL